MNNEQEVEHEIGEKPEPMSVPASRRNDRPISNPAQIVSAVCAVFTAVAACSGVISFYHSIKSEKVRAAEETIARLYPLDVNVNQSLGQNPKARAALYRDPTGEIFRQMSDNDKGVFKDACIALGGVFEYYLLVRDHIVDHPKGREIVASWDGYFKTICQRSYGFRGRINSERQTWTPMFLKEFDNYREGLPCPSADESE